MCEWISQMKIKFVTSIIMNFVMPAKENLELCTAISKWLVEKSYNIKNVKWKFIIWGILKM